MKNLTKIAAASMAMIASFSFAQKTHEKAETKIPQPILTAFHKEYANVKKVDWNHEDGNYEAEFNLNKTELTVTYNAKGEKLEVEKEIKSTQLPAAAHQYITKHKSGAINEASKIEKTNGETIYEAEVKGQELYFDASGKFLHSKKS